MSRATQDPYRDEAHALRASLDGLREEARQIHARMAEGPALAQRQTRVAAEIAALAARLRAFETRSTLDDLRIASPCRASWDHMVGDDRVRFCGGCRQNVYNVSGMSRAEAEAMLTAHTGRQLPCLRLFQRADGTILTADCPDAATKKKVRRLAMVAGAVAGVAATGAVGLLAMGAMMMGKPVSTPAAHAVEPRMPSGSITAAPAMLEEAAPAATAPPRMGQPMIRTNAR